jgi:hypothetical protein
MRHQETENHVENLKMDKFYEPNVVELDSYRAKWPRI